MKYHFKYKSDGNIYTQSYNVTKLTYEINENTDVDKHKAEVITWLCQNLQEALNPLVRVNWKQGQGVLAELKRIQENFAQG